MTHGMTRGGTGVRIVLAALAVVAVVAVVGLTGSEGDEHSSPATLDAMALDPAPRSDRAPTSLRAVTTASLGVYFEENRGQSDAEVAFVQRGLDHVTFLTPDGFSTSMVVARNADRTVRMAAHRVRLVGSDPAAEVVGERLLPGRVNHFKGADPDAWITDVPTFGSVRLREVYPGIDLVHHGDRDIHEYDFVVEPGADADRIEMEFEGVDNLQLAANGDLVVTDAGREIRHTRPLVYQDTAGGRIALAASFRMDGDRRVGFELGVHDPQLPLLIDPGIVYSTYLGGANEDFLRSVAVDSRGQAHVGGVSASADFPLASALDDTVAGFYDGLIVKMSAAGSGLIYSTFIGGAERDFVSGVAVADDGGVLAVGGTWADDFPIVAAAQPTYGGFHEAFILHLDAAGASIVSSTYLGGSGSEEAFSVVQDSMGRIYVAGASGSPDFPTTPGVVHPNPFGNGGGAFVARLSADESSFEYVTFVGGSGSELSIYFFHIGLFVDDAGRAHVGGITTSTDLPTSVGAFQPDYRRFNDGFVGRLSADGSSWDWMTYVGSGSTEQSCLIAPGPSGGTWIALSTLSTDLPATQAIQPAHAGGRSDLYLILLDSSGSSAITSTYLGGSSLEELVGLAADPTGGAWIAGASASPDFPTVDPFSPSLTGSRDMVLVKVGPLGRALEFSTYFGGSGVELQLGSGSSISNDGNLLTVDANGAAYVVGSTVSPDLPTAGPPFQSQPAESAFHGFIAKIGEPPPPLPVIDDTEIYILKGKFKINRVKHARGIAADTLSIKGVFNPRGLRADLAGATLTVSVNGTPLASGQLDSRGRARSASGTSPKFKLSVKAQKSTFQCKLGGLDLRATLGVADATANGLTRAEVTVTVRGAGLATDAVSGGLEFATKSRLGKSSAGKFVFKKHVSVDGAFKSLKTLVNELPGGGHTVSLTGPFVGLETRPLTFPGDVRITLGDGATITVPNASLRTSGTPGPRSTTSYSRGLGAVAGLTRLVYTNRKRMIILATSELGDLGIPAAGPGAPAVHPLPVVIEIDTTDGPVRFETVVELRRTSPTSRRWSR